jgi:beta-glucosidase
VRFPQGFLWGTATSAHQVEGGNWNSDWWAFEHQPGSPCVEPSGDACDHYHRYEDDLALLAGLGFNAYRFSLEWSRIEPEEGEFSRAALDHYRRMCAACREHGLVPVVTFHHFTLPRWVAAAGGFANPRSAQRFARYCREATRFVGDLAGYACTINEPNIVALMGYLVGVFPPGLRDRELRHAVTEVLVDAHRLGAEEIRAGPGSAPVGLTLSMTDYQALDGGEERVARIRRGMEDPFLSAAAADDFLGVQTYSRARVSEAGTLGPEEGVETTQMGYEFWPEALEATLRRAFGATGGKPALVVTENGVATDDDSRRVVYVRRALEGVLRCLADGIDVRGYFYWSAFDNFEWVLGYGPRFGLIEVDRRTFERRPKPSAAFLGRVAAANALEEAASPEDAGAAR